MKRVPGEHDGDGGVQNSDDITGILPALSLQCVTMAGPQPAVLVQSMHACCWVSAPCDIQGARLSQVQNRKVVPDLMMPQPGLIRLAYPTRQVWVAHTAEPCTAVPSHLFELLGIEVAPQLVLTGCVSCHPVKELPGCSLSPGTRSSASSSTRNITHTHTEQHIKYL